MAHRCVDVRAQTVAFVYGTDFHTTLQTRRWRFGKGRHSSRCSSQLNGPTAQRVPSGKPIRPRSVSAASVSDVASQTDAPDSLVAPDLPYRVGHGFDLHRLAEGYPLIIGGISIPHTKGCEAHSDGDVLLHCVVDAVLGALGLPDIGQLFPDNDPKWKGASSDIFMREAIRLMKERGYVVGNLDATLIAQKPKLSPHKENIRMNLCSLLEAHPSVVNLKAKTHEKVDSIGEERSIGCHTVVMLIKKELLKPVS